MPWPIPEPEISLRLSPRAWLRVLRRGLPLALVTFSCLILLLLVRVVERPLCGLRRPLTPWITRFVCTSAFVILGMERRVIGTPMKQDGAAVANHCGWLDIFTLNASKNIYFVSKSEVASWPGIGWLARATGTVFIARKSTEARRQQVVFEERLHAGHRLMFFPEGTSSDGLRVLPFKSTLFAAFFAPQMADLWIQPVTLIYRSPEGEPDPRFYGWWGDMDFAPHLLRTLAAKRQGAVTVRYHAPIAVSEMAGRKEMARACEVAVRDGLEEAGVVALD